jgi:hypothetical protein
MTKAVFFVLASILAGSPVTAADGPGDALAIMNKVAANTTEATEARRQYVYKQRVRASLVRTTGPIRRKETREYTVVPQKTTTEKALVSFSGEYRDGKQMVPYTQPGVKDKGDQGDRELIQELVEALVNAKNSRDGIPHQLFPLRSEELGYYRFSIKGESEVRGRHTYDIVFEPAELKDLCVHVGGDEENPCHQWKGEVWIDSQEFQPVRIETQMAKAVPWGVRVFLGTNVRQLGFSIDYQRVAENVWFPAAYGTEFSLDVLWGYKRTITLSMESSGFQKTDADSTIRYDLQR